ncbi:MAG: hypothetical protein WBF93_11445 [Pirellulales bacterium]
MPIASSRVVGLVTLQPHQRLRRERLTAEASSLHSFKRSSHRAITGRHSGSGDPPVRVVHANLAALMEELQAELNTYYARIDAI